MRVRFITIALLALAVTLIAPCAPSREDVAHDSAVANLGTRMDAPDFDVDTVGHGKNPSQPDTATAQHFTWTTAQVEAVLSQLELSPSRNPQLVRQPFLSVPGAVFRIRGGELQAYLYGDRNARAHDTDLLDPVRVSPPTMMVSWRLPPTLIVDNNLAVIVLTRDAGLRQRLRDALGPHAHQ